jgi:aminoglycoside phosphotransferase family enzyme
MPLAHPVGLARTLQALHDPGCYPAPVADVQAVETHMSWVFLAGEHAWKLKKPVLGDGLDFRTAAGRHFYGLEELRLNRRLAPAVYLDVVPLTLEADGTLRIAGRGAPVDWLVKMRRLPPEALLDALLARHAAQPEQLRAVARRLAEFHRSQPPAPLDGRGFRALLQRHIEESERELCDPAWGLPCARVHALCEAQRAWLRQRAHLFGLRVAAGRVIEGHGDLRPQHVWLGEPLAITDALEFSPELRLLDAADEAGFLALECERAHAPGLAREFLQAWRDASGDEVPPALLDFYQSCRACIRARLAVAHLREERYRASPLWRWRALRYLALARRHMARAQPV